MAPTTSQKLHLDTAIPGVSETKARLLAVSPQFPWPVRDGFTLRVSRILEELKDHWHLTLLCAQGTTDTVPPTWVRTHQIPLTGEVRVLPWGYSSDRLIDGLSSFEPDSFDAALLWAGSEVLLPHLGTKRLVIDRVDCGWLATWRDLRSTLVQGYWLRRLYWLALTARYERWIAATGNRVVVVGEPDARAIRRLSSRAHVHVVPNGVDIPEFDEPPRKAVTPTVVFTGVMSFQPNCQAVEWFVDRCWPSVRAAIPSATFRIVGRDPNKTVSALSSQPGVEVIGAVPSVAQELRQAWAAVAPMRSGAGIKNKVLEAWACGIPVVMSSMATGGLRLPQDHETLIADHPDKFSETVVSLLSDSRRAGALGLSAAAAARDASWHRAGEAINELLRSGFRLDALPFRSAR